MRGTWQHRNGHLYEMDFICTPLRTGRHVERIKARAKFAFTDHVTKECVIRVEPNDADNKRGIRAARYQASQANHEKQKARKGN
eukprot:5593763-Pyramimonas_sp.AAC.1